MNPVSPLFKTNDPLIVKNFRPVSVLSSFSKVFECMFYDQMYDYFVNIFSSYLSAFRKTYGCHHVLLDGLENCPRQRRKRMQSSLI